MVIQARMEVLLPLAVATRKVPLTKKPIQQKPLDRGAMGQRSRGRAETTSTTAPDSEPSAGSHVEGSTGVTLSAMRISPPHNRLYLGSALVATSFDLGRRQNHVNE